MLRDYEDQLLTACAIGPEAEFWKAIDADQLESIIGLLVMLNTLRDQKGHGWDDLARKLGCNEDPNEYDLQGWLNTRFVSLSRFLPMLRMRIQNQSQIPFQNASISIKVEI